MDLTSWQNQIICGTLLGNGYISRTMPVYLGMSESHQWDWVKFKAAELGSVGARTPFSESGKVLKWRSRSGEGWRRYEADFYQEGTKRVAMATLDSLRDIALAVWFGDKGYWYSSRRVGLRSTALGDSNPVLRSYFREVGLSCDLKTDTHGASRIVFDREGTQKFLRTIAHRLPTFMHHRLVPPFAGKSG